MKRQQLIWKKEKNASAFMAVISLLGFGLIFSHLSQLPLLKEPIILLLFAVFLAICEYYPIPVWKGNTTINFPILFTLYLVYGLHYTLVIYAAVTLIVNLINRRPLRIVLFNPAQLVLSFYIAVQTVELIEPVIANQTPLINGFIHYVLLLIIFYFINNLMVDLVLLLRPQAYPFHSWKQKTISEFYSSIISLIYGLMLFLLGSQNRGEIDFFSFFFFFSPLVGVSLLSAVIFRLRKEKSRLHALFSITSELNNMVPTEDWLDRLKTSLPAFIDVDASILWVKEEKGWKSRFTSGGVQEKIVLHNEYFQKIDYLVKPIVYHNRHSDIGIATACFDQNMKSFVYAPLIVEKDKIGYFIVARNRTKSFAEEDISLIATFANQLAIVLKTRNLIREQEKRLIVEERNRIAREIHDGVAQSLAGAIMSLETAERKYQKSPEQTFKLISGSIVMLRKSLREVRESIYALRPYPTQRMGLIPAIRKKIKEIMNAYHFEVQFEVRGKLGTLSSMTEKVLFDVFQESIMNSVKHSMCSEIHVLLSSQSEHILLRITDNGVGFSLFHEMIKARNNSHFGILNMNESIEKVNGTLQIDSKEGIGTEISVIIPKMGLEGEEKGDKSYVSR